METYFAYRLPHQNQIHFCKGKGEWIKDLTDCPEEGFIFHSFDGSRILLVRHAEPVLPEEMNLSPLEQNLTETDKSAYFKQFNTLKQAIYKGDYQKVILSRTKTVPTHISSLTLFERLNQNYKNTFNYLVFNPEIGIWMGATPELLLAVNDCQLETMSLAGTKTTHENWTIKENEEQILVTDTIVQQLHKTGCEYITCTGPQTLAAGPVEHLYTQIKAKLTHSTFWKSVLLALHPTPAVCGLPTTAARQFIPTLEGYNREFYTGFIGVFTPEKKNFYVNLRCMQLTKNAAKLYIGGGITALSEVEAEWNETERKAETLIRLLK